MGRLLRVPGYPISVQSIIFPRPDGVGHPPRRSQSPSTAPLGRGVTALRRASWAIKVTWFLLGLVQGCFKMYWGLLRVGFRVGLRFREFPHGSF